jgi:carboxymethylenebutenolidase
MATIVEFKSNGQTASGYLATPASGRGAGVLVIQEWWGLDSGIKTMADRLAEAGFVALAPDLYHGELAQHDEMDKAAHLMQSLPAERAGKDMSGAVDYLASHPAVTSRGIGAFIIAANRPDQVKALVPFYGFPQGDGEPDYSKIAAAISGHMAEQDSYFPPVKAKALEAHLRALGKTATTGHAFMGPHNALGTHNPALAATIWPEVVSFLRTTLA